MRLIKETLWCLLLLALLVTVVVGGLWLRNHSAVLGSILGNVNAASFNMKTATWNASDAAWQADQIASDPLNGKAIVQGRHDVLEVTGEWARVSKHLAKTSQDVVDQENNVAGKWLEVASTLNTTVGTLNGAIDSDGGKLRGTLQSLEETSKSAKGTIDDFDRQIVNNQALGETFRNTAGISASWNDLSSDAVKVERRYFFPQPYTGNHRFLHAIGKDAYGVVRTVGPFGELYYYLSSPK